jgi:L-ascorbate metabolism protein UlaG (beta-lactamase superfamily)
MNTLAIRFLGHSTVRIELAGRVILTDPVLTPRVGPLTRVTRMPQPADWQDADLILISHLHADHLHVPSLRRLGRRATVLVPRRAASWLHRRGVTWAEELDVGESYTDGPLRVTGVPAEHSGHRWGPKLTCGPQSRAMGHLIVGCGTRLYASGDTDLFNHMPAIAPLDVALLPVWGWGPNLGPGHLDPVRAAEAVGLLRPRIAVPVHWGTLAPAGMPRWPGRLGARMRRLLVEPPHDFADAVAAAGHRTDVPVTVPGGNVQLDALADRDLA